RCEDVHDTREPDHQQGDVDRPDELAVLATLAGAGQQPDDPEEVHDVPCPGAPDAETFAPQPACSDQARQHVEERAEVHHRQPRQDHAAHVSRPDPAEAEPGDPAERLGRDELGRKDEPEEVDDGQPEDGREEPVLRGAVRKRKRAFRATAQDWRSTKYLRAWACRPLGHLARWNLCRLTAKKPWNYRTVIRESCPSHLCCVMVAFRCGSWLSRTSLESSGFSREGS